MVRSKYLLAAAVAVAAGLTVFSCTKKEESQQESKVGFATTDAQFSQDGKATLSLAVSPAASSKVSVIIAAGSEAQEGFTAVPATALSFESSVSIEAGATEATVEVSVDLAAVEDGQQAVLTLSAANGATIDAQKATAYIKVVKAEEPAQVDLSGASVWGLIGGFNEWGADVELTKTADSPEKWEATGVALSGEFKFRGNKEWGDYDLGAAQGFSVVPGEEFALVHKGSNITIAEGIYDIVLYPTELKAVITASENVPGSWKLTYKGCEWVEGYYGSGQLEIFDVSGTDKAKYYMPILIDAAADGDIASQIDADPETYFATIQEELDEDILYFMDEYDMKFDEALPYLVNNEEVSGTEVLFRGAPIGSYQFVVFPVTVDFEAKTATYDGTYQFLDFEKTTDPIETYIWLEQGKLREDWSVQWDGWVEGYEGDYFWVIGQAPGAAYVYCEWYTDDEMDAYYDGDVSGLINQFGSYVADGFYWGEDPEDELYLAPVAADGSFEYFMDTYGDKGPFKVYIVACDANGKVIADYGVTEIEGEGVPAVEWVEKTDWAVNYDPAHPGAVVATACDADYYIIEVYPAGFLSQKGIDYIADDAIYYVENNGLSTCLSYGYAFDSVPGVFSHTYYPVQNGNEVFIFGLTEAGDFTGEWHMEAIEGVPVINWTERKDWAVNYDASIDTGEADYPQAVVVTACDAKYFDIALYNANTLENYGIEAVADDHQDWTGILDYYGETMDDQVTQGYMGSSSVLPYVTPCKGLVNGVEVFIFSYNEDGTFDGEWHMEPLTGLADAAAVVQRLKASGLQPAKKMKAAPASPFQPKPAFREASTQKHSAKLNIDSRNRIKNITANASKHGKKIVLSK